LYIKDADVPLIEQAKKKLGDSLSAVFVDCVRQRLDQQAVAKGKMGKITVETRKDLNDPLIRKRFEGRWLVHPDQMLTAEPDDSGVQWDCRATYSLAQSKKGALVVYEANGLTGRRGLWDSDSTARLEVYDHFDALKVDEQGGYPRYPQNVIAAFADVLGEPHILDLDI
jgi:hypothetical protein